MTINDLLKTKLFNGAKVLSGEKGLKSECLWCSPDPTVDFIKSEEKVIVLNNMLIVFIGLPENVSWTEYLDYTREKMKYIGILFLGPDIEKYSITKEALDYSDKHNFPFIWVPTDIDAITFLNRIGFYTILAQNTHVYSQLWLQNVLFLNDNLFDNLSASNYGYCEKYQYVCVLVEHIDELRQIDIEYRLDHLREVFSEKYSYSEAKVLFLIKDNSLVCMLPFPMDTSNIALRESARASLSEIKDSLQYKVKISVGTPAKTIEDFHESFKNAAKTEQIIKRLGVHEKISFYDDWHMHMMLLDRPENELRDFMTQALLPLLPHQDLLNTLIIYLTFSGNLSDTSKELYIHMSTLKYRLGKIKEMLGCDLKDTTTCFRLRMAITIYRYLNG